MALGIQVDEECPDPRLGQTKPIRGRDSALPCPPFKVEEELFSNRFNGGRKSKIVPILADILWLIVAFLIGIPLRGWKDSFSLFLKELVFRNPEDLCKGHR
jgi:hypothetical protein